MPDGEAHKNLATVAALYDEFLRLGLERSSTVVALGGGVVGDVAGFAAGTYLRGLPVVQVPTTLLAMVDSSTGGKTGVDLPGGKNLVGVFHQPRGVLCDPEVLATLPPVEMRCGLAEVVKSAIIADAELFVAAGALRGCAAGAPTWPLPEIIRRTIAIKAAVVAADPTEQGAARHAEPGPHHRPRRGAGQRLPLPPWRGGEHRAGGGGPPGRRPRPVPARPSRPRGAAARPASACPRHTQALIPPWWRPALPRTRSAAPGGSAGSCPRPLVRWSSATTSRRRR